MNEGNITHECNLYEHLVALSDKLIEEWCQTLLKFQLKDTGSDGLNGGIISPAYSRIEGRCAESIYPFLFMANNKGDEKFLDAAIAVMRWAENNVCMPDGSWINEVSVSDWRGVTVNALIALIEALKWHGNILDNNIKQLWESRIILSSEYVYNNIDIGYGNINYPVVSTYAMMLAGEYLNNSKYTKRAIELAGKVRTYFTANDNLLFGEGQPLNLKSPKGCYSLDLGYNVEESLPALALYTILSKDIETQEILIKSLQSHLEFLLPDGGWDNSWGTRNYKWTYWGSRNSDGCQPAYALLADKDPRFLKAALLNTQLLNDCTANGILHGGPHNIRNNEFPSLHHTFCHAKALTTILDYGIPKTETKDRMILPREDSPALKQFTDIQSWLVSIGDFRATVTGYDREYCSNSHATGGTLSLLWHKLTGPLIAAGITDYRLIEATNMQVQKAKNNLPITPSLVYVQNNIFYRSCSDLSAEIDAWQNTDKIIIAVHASLVDGIQNNPDTTKLSFKIIYTFTENTICIEARILGNKTPEGLYFYLPIIADKEEELIKHDNYTVAINKHNAKIYISADCAIETMFPPRNRLFNFVPGFMAIPLKIICRSSNEESLFKLCMSVQKLQT
jgi:hypothetical protein